MSNNDNDVYDTDDRNVTCYKNIGANFYENCSYPLVLSFRKLGLTTNYISQVGLVVKLYTSVFQSPIPVSFYRSEKLLVLKVFLFLKLLGTGGCI
jgi:hypothetical protein